MKPYWLSIALFLSVVLVSAATATASSHGFASCVLVHRDYLVTMVWLNGSVIKPLTHVYTNDSVANIYAVLSLVHNESREPSIRITGVKRIGRDYFVYVEVAGKDVAATLDYIVNGNISIAVRRINESWLSVELRLTNLAAEYGIDLLKYLGEIKAENLVPAWMNLSTIFLINTRDGETFLKIGEKLVRVGASPLFPYNLTLSPDAYAYVLVHNALKILEEIQKQSSQSVNKLLAVLRDGIIPSYAYLGSTCSLEPVENGLSETCRLVANTSYNVAEINYTALREPGFAKALYAAAKNNDAQRLEKLLSKVIAIKRFSITNVTHGAVVALEFHAPAPREPRDFAVFYAPVRVNDLDAVMLVVRGPDLGLETINDQLRKTPTKIPGNATIRYEEEAINGVPVGVLRVFSTNSSPIVTIYLWPRDLNGTDYMCTYYGKTVAPILLRAQQAWSKEPSLPEQIFNKVVNPSPGTSIAGLKNLETTLLNKSTELLAAKTAKSITEKNEASNKEAKNLITSVTSKMQAENKNQRYIGTAKAVSKHSRGFLWLALIALVAAVIAATLYAYLRR